MHQTEELEECLYQPLDNDENTIVHLAAEGGHVPVFKVSNWPYIFAWNLTSTSIVSVCVTQDL